ncbi:expressed unknown protein [Seminavis robusta]|uniref:Uncharacterized protein n=1 Tax=Seminavis robusta TaxID=568900 RepID=A0A9N8EE65_9STRA|nr:expressed unknown protein [Seminavis robusta]|eukprot:Sro961_g225050.1 n/a (539) ;mRNA; r:38410-40026
MDSTELASAVALASLASFSPSTQKPTSKPFDPQNSQHVERAFSMPAALESRSPSSDPMPVSPDVRSPIRAIKRVSFANSNTPPTGDTQETFDFHHAARAPPSAQAFPIQFPPNAVTVLPGRPDFSHPWMHPRMPPHPPPHHPPPRMMHGQSFSTDLHWICDYCNAAAFSTYEEACVHEQACKMQCRQHGTGSPRFPLGQQQSSMATAGKSKVEGETGNEVPTRAASNVEWFSGSVSLCIPDSDAEWLSEINCFLRKYCVEAFSATEEDVLSTSKRGRITLHQVGIRCVHCKHKPLKERAVAAVSYPTSVAGIYESVKRFHRIHVEHCECIPDQVRAKMVELNNLNIWIPTTRQYWTDSARALGMVDTDEGIRFSCDPQFIRSVNAPDTAETTASSQQARKDEGQRLKDGDHIVFPEDMMIVPAYVYFLMRQVESCHFSEVDRFVARSKGPVGYPGFQCRHCSGHAGLGKYFPVSAKTLSTNSTSQNIHAHLLKCRKCPDAIKEKLVALKVEKSRAPRLEPGWRKLFFDKVWQRLHGAN